MPLQMPDVVEPGNVVERSPQVRLQHDADVLVALVAQLAVQRERAVGRRRVLHVDAHEAAARGGVDDDRLEVLAAEVEVELEPERGELDRDVRVEPLLVDPRQHVVVLARDRARLVGARDLLAEHVDGRELPFRVQPSDDAHRVVERRARRCSATRAAGRRASERPAAAGRSRGREEPRARGMVEESACSGRPVEIEHGLRRRDARSRPRSSTGSRSRRSAGRSRSR